MHITHAKAGSTWINNLFAELFPSRVAPRGRSVAAATDGDLDRHVFAPGRIYRAMFLTREKFLLHPELRDCRRFIVIRDLRDTLVSLYFSMKLSHPHDTKGRAPRHRAELQQLGTEEGLLYLLTNELPGAAAMQRSWLGLDEILLRYEDLLIDGFPLLRKLLLDRFALPVSEASLARAFRRTHFERVYKRKLGEEDVHSHGRKGVPGDWANHFTPAVKRRFAEMFGPLLIATGYEKDDAWAV
jgi:lipopolysaccharide transport system ATP-binding protein